VLYRRVVVEIPGQYVPQRHTIVQLPRSSTTYSDLLKGATMSSGQQFEE
jgi:hypothetical protein